MNQAEIVRDRRFSPVELEEVKMKEVIIYDSHGNLVHAGQGLLESKKAKLCLSSRIKKKSRYLEHKIDKIQIADSPEPINSAKKELSPQTYLKVKGISEDEGHTSTKREITKVLESFDASPGFGDFLKKLLPKELKKDSDRVTGLLLFVNERQHLWYCKYHDREDLKTTNRVMTEKWFTNMYRELDRGTQYFWNCLSSTTLAEYNPDLDGLDEDIIKETLWKSVVYRLSNKVQTFKKLGGIPDVDDFNNNNFKEEFLRLLEIGSKPFTAAHQNNEARRYFETLEYVCKNLEKLTGKIVQAAERRSAKGVFEVVNSIPGVGNFFAYQILCDLTESRMLGSIKDNQWTKLGPGAQMGLREGRQDALHPHSSLSGTGGGGCQNKMKELTCRQVNMKLKASD